VRIKDDIKQEALFEATIKVVNELGFASSSVSKIAKEAGISPATIYIYHENKEDLIVSTYMTIKKNLTKALMKDFDDTLPIRDILRKVWLNSFRYAIEYRAHFRFKEQFSNSPYISMIDESKIDEMLMPLVNVFMRGIEQKILKDVGLNLFLAFTFYPVVALSNPHAGTGFEAKDVDIEKAFDMAWDAIKL
jgi:AcrR family transcriptional regulator